MKASLLTVSFSSVSCLSPGIASSQYTNFTRAGPLVWAHSSTSGARCIRAWARHEAGAGVSAGDAATPRAAEREEDTTREIRS